MKKIAALLIAFTVCTGTLAYADGVELYRVSDDAALNCISTSSEQTGWRLAKGADVGGFLLTENGYVVTDGEAANKTVTLACGSNQRVIAFCPSRTYDFESTITSAETFQGTVSKENENSFLSASAESPSNMILSDSIKGSSWTLTFDAYKSASEAATLFAICNENGDIACEVKLNRRGSGAFYPACLEGTSYTTYHDYLISISEWFSVEVYADFEKGTVNVKIPSVEFDVTYAMEDAAGKDFSVYKITFGQNVDNVNFYNGKKLKNAQIAFDIADVVNVPADTSRYHMDIPVKATFDGVSGRLAKTADFLVYSDKATVSPDGILTLPKSMNDISVKARCFTLGENIEITKNFSFVAGENENALPVCEAVMDVVEVDLDNQKAVISGYNPTNADFSANVYICIFKNGECLKLQRYPILMEALCGEFEKEVGIDVSELDMTGAAVKALVINSAMKDIQ